ncbi:F-box protein CPR1-like [Argentina anserina]|uniref:F-box protein CPR1-like n=1 Tax=Argentina anserina TaxID=57926 RepID=UPI00217691FA|nr:F-box protein CPR1-like [Potentilla anserina]
MPTQQEQQDRDASALNQTQSPNGVIMSNPTPEETTTTETVDETAVVSQLPLDVIGHILKRLPAKSLARCRCVCRPWVTLLKGSAFIKSHLQRNRAMFQSDLKTNTRLILARYCDTLLSTTDSDTKNVMQAEELNFPLVKNLPYYVKGHSDGLLCLVINDGNEGMLVVYNPSIQEYRKLPSPPDFRSTREAIGIGYDKKIDDYKVVRVPCNYCRMKVPGYKPKVEILELKANVWRQIPEEDTPPYFVEHVFQAAEVNGGLYWLVEDQRIGDAVIMRFDLTEEKFRVVKPPPIECSRSVAWIGPLKDWLCVVHTRRLSDIDVWATNDDKTWTKLITTSKFPRVPDRDPFMDSFRYMPLCYTETGAVLMSVRGERFLTFDCSTNVFEHIDILGAKHWLQETMYCESLVSPGVGIHPTEAAGSSATAINLLSGEDEAEEDNEEAENSSSVLMMMTSLKRELANLLACTVGLRHAQE